MEDTRAKLEAALVELDARIAELESVRDEIESLLTTLPDDEPLGEFSEPLRTLLMMNAAGLPTPPGLPPWLSH